ncbi:hypothetical protein NSND_60618 [Nitrospira sp. ND1]|nr:hypothetical protein NSND_60618 [Nitrospira sp. ND1]
MSANLDTESPLLVLAYNATPTELNVH